MEKFVYLQFLASFGMPSALAVNTAARSVQHSVSHQGNALRPFYKPCHHALRHIDRLAGTRISHIRFMELREHPIFPYTRQPFGAHGVRVHRDSRVFLPLYDVVFRDKLHRDGVHTLDHSKQDKSVTKPEIESNSVKKETEKETNIRRKLKSALQSQLASLPLQLAAIREWNNVKIIPKQTVSVSPTKTKSSQFTSLYSQSHRHYATISLTESQLTASVPLEESAQDSTRPWIGHWFNLCAALILGIIAVGGWTRLTESGLSMTDWQLLQRRAPSTPEEWEAAFEKYKQFPEYQRLNRHMTLEQFKQIYFWEYAHRTFGRVLGAVILLPTLLVHFQPQLASHAVRRRMTLMSFLVVVQGLYGWYMVQSGLDVANVDARGGHPRVSPVRLTIHLGLAVTTFLVARTGALHILEPAVRMTGRASATLLKHSKIMRGSLHGLFSLVMLTLLSGGLVAGNDAGLIYNSYPWMGESVVPSDGDWRDAASWVYNAATVQFNHRWLGTASTLGVVTVYALGRRLPLPRSGRWALNTMLALGLLQMTLGLGNLFYLVPVPMASAHQINAVLLLSSMASLQHALRRLPK